MLSKIGSLSVVGLIAVKGTKIGEFEVKKTVNAADETGIIVAKGDQELKVEATKQETL